MSLSDTVIQYCERALNSQAALKWRMRDVDRVSRQMFQRVAPFTMTSPERVAAVCNAVHYVTRAKIPGAYVECGVWRGGSSMAAALCLQADGAQDRELYLFDTFEGMSTPTEHDVRADDSASAAGLLDRSLKTEKIWCCASLEDVEANMASTGYPSNKVHLCKGMVEETLPREAPETIAILRLDTDWYESTKHELEHLYPRLAVGGVLIIDDYGYWAGARKAVDEYFADRPVLLSRIDRTGRIAIKVTS